MGGNGPNQGGRGGKQGGRRGNNYQSGYPANQPIMGMPNMMGMPDVSAVHVFAGGNC